MLRKSRIGYLHFSLDTVDEFSHIKKLFTLKIPSQNPPFPEEFHKILPDIDVSALKKRQITENILVEKLALTVRQRRPVIRWIKNNLNAVTTTDANTENVYALILRSFCCLYFQDISSLSLEVLELFVDSLVLAQEINPSGAEQTFYTFYLLYLQISTSFLAEKCLNFVNSFFKAFPVAPFYFIPIHLEYVFNLLQNGSDLEESSFFLKHLERIVNSLKTIKKEEITIKIDCINQLYEAIYEKCSEKDKQIINPFKSLLMGLANETARITGKPFTQMREIVKEFVKDRDLESSPKVDLLQHIERKGDFMLPTNKKAQHYVDSLPEPIKSLITFFTKVPNESAPIAFKSIFATTKEINSLPLVEFSLVLLSLPSFKGDEMREFLEKIDYPQIFFSSLLFTPEFSFFQRPVSNIVKLRLFAIELYKSLYSKLSKDSMATTFLPLLISLTPYTYMFAELLYTCRSIIDFSKMDKEIMREIILCFHAELNVQYAMENDKFPFVIESKTTTFFILREFASNEVFCRAVIESREMMFEAVRMISESDITSDTALFISALFAFAINNYKTVNLTYLFKEITDLLNTISKEDERRLKVGGTILTVIHESLVFAKDDYFQFFSKSSLFTAVNNYIRSLTTIAKTPFTEENISPVFVTSLRILSSFSFAMMKKLLTIDWNPFADVIRRFGVSLEVYQVIINIVSLNQISFTGINCIEAAPLVLPILESQFRQQFLTELLVIVNNSFVQCINCVKAGLHSYLLDLLKTNKDDIDEALIIPILMKISSALFDRESLFKCIELTDPANKSNKYSGTVLRFLSQAVNEKVEKVKNFLQFTAQLGSVVLPNISTKEFLSDVTISGNILLTDFNSESDKVHLINFSSENNFLAFVLSKNTITAYSSIFTEKKEIQIDFPINKWFNLTISFNNLSSFTIYVSGEKAGEFESSCNTWKEPIQKIVMFHPIPSMNMVHHSTVTGQVSRIYFFLSPANEKILNTVTNIESEFTELLNLPKLIMMYSPEFSDKNELINIADSDFGNAKFTMYSFTNVCSIKDIFVGTKGISLIIAQFSRIDYTADNADKLFNELLLAISEFIVCSEEIQSQMLNCNAFSSIALHMSKLSVKHLSKRIRSTINHIEKSITNEKLLSSFYQHMILEFPNWFQLDEDVIYKLLRLWNHIAMRLPEIFIDDASFTSIIERCYTLIKSDKFNADISNEMLSIMLTSAQLTCNVQTVGIIIRLLQYTKNNEEFSLRLLHMLKTLGEEVPSMAKDIQEEVITNKALICGDSPLMFVTIVELFAVNEALCIDCIVYLLGECYDRNDPEKMSQTATILCQELVSGSGTETLDELIAKKSFRGVSSKLIPFICIVSFYCLPETVPKISEFLTAVFANQRSLKTIASSITTTGLFFALIFTLVISPEFIMSLVSLFSINTQLFADAFSLIDTIALYAERDGHTIQNALASALSLVVSERRDPEEISRFVNIVSTFLCYGSDRSVFSKHEQKEIDKSFNLFRFIEIFRANPVVKKPLSFGLYIVNGEWDDINIAILLVYMLQDGMSIENVRRIIILMYFILTADSGYTPQIIPQIEQLAARTDITTQDLSPLFLVMSKKPDDFRSATAFFQKYEQQITNTIETYQSAITCIKTFSETLCTQSEVERDIRILFDTTTVALPIIQYSFETIVSLIRTGMQARKGYSQNKWNNFWEMLEEDLTPFFNPITHSEQFIRANRFDTHFRPILFKKSRNIEDINKVDDNSVKDVLNFTDYDESKPTFIGSCPRELWSAKCQKISIKKVINGMMYVTPSKLVFQGEKYPVVIMGTNIKCIFWRWTFHKPDAITIFTSDFKGFIFRFPGQKSHKFTKQLKQVNMPNCFFFQEDRPEVEIEKLQLTQKWRSRQISNFDYLMWLNLFSGRSFIDVHSYPIFPWLLTDAKTPEPKRDLRHNIAFKNKNLLKVRREKQKEAFDPSDIELFDHTFSSAPEVARFNARVAPFTSLYSLLDCKEMFTSYEEEIKDYFESETPKITELTPEFFFSPEFLNPGPGMEKVELPSYAKSAEEFIYQNRRALESETVSKALPSWIDHVWGVKQRGSAAISAFNSVDFRLIDTVWEMPDHGDEKEIKELLIRNGEVPHLLFAGAHPSKLPITVPKPQKQRNMIVTNLEGSVTALKVTGESAEKLRIYLLLDNYKFICLKLPYSTTSIDMPALPKIMHPCSSTSQVAFLGGDSTSFAFINNFTTFPYFFDNERKQYIDAEATPHIKEVTCLCNCGQTIISGGAGGEVAQWRINENTEELVDYGLQHEDPIACIAASEALGIVASVSINGLLIISTIPNLKFLRAHRLDIKEGMVPTKIVITEEMGYIVIFFKLNDRTILQSYTINAKFIREAAINATLTDTIGFTSPDYVDTIGALTTSRKLLLIDAFTFTVTKNIDYKYDLNKLQYHKESGKIVIATRDNAILVVTPFIE